MDEVLVDRVLRAAECVPPGCVANYGLIAALVGTGPRQVGAVMSAWGGTVPWWRVTNAQGTLPGQLLHEARERWLQEGTPIRTDGQGCAIRRALVDPESFADDVRLATADLPPSEE